MKSLSIYGEKKGYVPYFSDEKEVIASDYYTAYYLQISYEEYIGYMKQYGASMIEIHKNDVLLKYALFESHENCQRFVDEIIEPRLVMKKLTD